MPWSIRELPQGWSAPLIAQVNGYHVSGISIIASYDDSKPAIGPIITGMG
jgi:hypothetical protein